MRIRIPAKFEKYNMYFLALIIFLIPFNVYFIPLMTVILAISLLLSENRNLNFKKNYTNTINKQYLFLSIFLFGYLIIGLIYSNNIPVGINELKKQLAIILVPALLLMFKNDDLLKNRKTLLYVLSIAVLLATFYSYFHSFQQAFQVDETGKTIFKLSPFTDMKEKSFWELVKLRSGYFTYSYLSHRFHPSYYALIIDSVIAFLILESIRFFKQKQYLVSALLFVSFLHLSFFIVLLQSRAGLLSYFAIIGLVIIYLFYSVKKLRKLVIILSIVSLLAGAFVIKESRLYKNIKEITAYEQSNSITEIKDKRLLIWQSSVNIIRENWFFGIGTGEQKEAIHTQMQKDKNPLYISDHEYDPHNQFLSFWIEIGIPGLFLFLLWLFFPLYIAIKTNKLYLAIISIVISINLLFETMLNRAIGLIFISIIISLLLFSNGENALKKQEL